MLSTDDVLNERMLRAVVESGHSRVPIHRAGDKTDLVRDWGEGRLFNGQADSAGRECSEQKISDENED